MEPSELMFVDRLGNLTVKIDHQFKLFLAMPQDAADMNSVKTVELALDVRVEDKTAGQVVQMPKTIKASGKFMPQYDEGQTLLGYAFEKSLKIPNRAKVGRLRGDWKPPGDDNQPNPVAAKLRLLDQDNRLTSEVPVQIGGSHNLCVVTALTVPRFSTLLPLPRSSSYKEYKRWYLL